VATRDDRAYEQLYRATWSKALALAFCAVKDSAQAEDALQDAYLELWSKADRFDPSRGTAQHWISMTVHQRAVDRVRRSVRERRRLTAYAASRHERAAIDSTAETAAERLDQEELRHAIDSLDLPERQVLHLSYWEGLSHTGIAAALQLPVGTVKSRIRRAQTRLRRRLEARVAA
jgi:RNA polymerase sigma-70 factor (ECF subfamily)